MLAGSSLAGALRSAMAQQVEVDCLDARARVLEVKNRRSREALIALHHSLLTPPPEVDHLHVVARYQLAAQDLEIGGDWYGAFVT